MKSLKTNLLVIIVCLCYSYSASANHILGADITYKSKGNNKYLVTIKLYRDCNSIPISPPQSKILCASTNIQVSAFTPSEISVRNITPTCGRVGKPCNPQNTTSGRGVEEHTYTATLDFTSIKNNGCCQILIGTGGCCRSENITTGASGQNFWITALINLCLKKPNNSPVFYSEPKTVFNCNQPVYNTLEAHDTLDNDSLVYEMVAPMQDWTKKTTWTDDKDSNMPFSAYCVGSCFPALPTYLPPRGFYLNSITGNMIFTPTNCNESSIFSIRVTEYRKDSTSKYVNIGYIIRDHQARVLSMTNIPAKPIITKAGKTLSSNYSSGNQWYEGITKINGATSQTYISIKAGTYFVEYTDTNGCLSARSDPISFLSVSKVKLPGLKIYPNPANDYLIIETGESGKFHISLIDITGKLIKEETFFGNHFEWQLKPAKGLYHLKIVNEKGESENVAVEFK